MQIIIGNIISGGIDSSGGTSGAPAILMESSGYILMETGSNILTE